MAIKRNRRFHAEIATSALSDIMFFLLLFFLIISTLASPNVIVPLPEAKEDVKPIADPVEPTVVITENNQYVLMPGGSLDKPLTFEQIKPLAAAEVEKSGKPKLRIAGHKKASYEAVFNILSLAQANGWDPILAYDK
jgi:biopolymer transport protein ExbD